MKVAIIGVKDPSGTVYEVPDGLEDELTPKLVREIGIKVYEFDFSIVDWMDT
jgi:hypothetical protein